MKASKITAVDFFEDLSSSYARRRFFAGFSIIIAVCILIVWFITTNFPSSTPKEILLAILIQIVSSSVITLAFYILFVYFIGPNKAVREVNVIRPQDIRERMLALPSDARHYVFWGRSGSFFRAYPLMELDRQARENKHVITIDVLLPDPDEERLVKSYRDILKSLGEEAGENPLLPNVLATCMTCAILASNNKYLEIKVHLSRFLPAFRIDLSDNGGILTQDDKIKSAIYFDHNSEFWDMFRSTVANERDVSRSVGWDKEMFESLQLEDKSCNVQTLNAFGIKVDDGGALQQEVARLITQRPHRYK